MNRICSVKRLAIRYMSLIIFEKIIYIVDKNCLDKIFYSLNYFYISVLKKENFDFFTEPFEIFKFFIFRLIMNRMNYYSAFKYYEILFMKNLNFLFNKSIHDVLII